MNDDQQLIELFFARDERAIKETAIKYSTACMQTAMNIVGSRRDAEECVNDSLLILWQSIPPKNPEYFAAYLMAIVRYRAIRCVKSLHREKRGGKYIRLDLEHEINTLSAPDDVSEQAEQTLLSEAINQFLSELPEVQQIMFVKRYYLYHTAAEIAKEMHLSHSNVRVTLMRLKNKLKDWLEKEDLL